MKLIWTFFNLSAAVPLFRSAFDFIRNNGGLSMNFVENKRRPEHRNCPPFQTTLSHSRSPTPHRISKICIYKDIDSARHCSGSVLREGRGRGRGEGGCVCVCVLLAIGPMRVVIIFWINENTLGQSVTEFFVFHYWPRSKNKINLFSHSSPIWNAAWQLRRSEENHYKTNFSGLYVKLFSLVFCMCQNLS